MFFFTIYIYFRFDFFVVISSILEFVLVHQVIAVYTSLSSSLSLSLPNSLSLFLSPTHSPFSLSSLFLIPPTPPLSLSLAFSLLEISQSDAIFMF